MASPPPSPPSSPPSPKKTRGRQVVAMERMEKDSNRMVTFAKRREGVFKKASELCTLCGVQALCVVFSPADKTFAYGHPSVDAIINRFLFMNNDLPQDNQVSTGPIQNQTVLRSNMEVSLLKDRLEIERKRTKEHLKERKLKSKEAKRFIEPPKTLTLAELKQMKATLTALKHNLHTHYCNLVEAQSNLGLNPNPSPLILDGQNYQGQNPFSNPSSNVLGKLSEMTMVQPPLMRNANDNDVMTMRSNLTNAGFTNPNIPQTFQGPTNLIPGSFDGQRTMRTDMGWNPIPGEYRSFTGMLMGEGSSNYPALPFNPQEGYMGSNPIPGNYQIFTDLMGEGSFNSPAPPFNPHGRYMGSNPIPGEYQTFRHLMGEGSSNLSIPPLNPQGGYMGSNPIPGDYQTFRDLMGEGGSNPSIPPFNSQRGFGFGPGIDPGMN